MSVKPGQAQVQRVPPSGHCHWTGGTRRRHEFRVEEVGFAEGTGCGFAIDFLQRPNQAGLSIVVGHCLGNCAQVIDELTEDAGVPPRLGCRFNAGPRQMSKTPIDGRLLLEEPLSLATIRNAPAGRQIR